MNPSASMREVKDLTINNCVSLCWSGLLNMQKLAHIRPPSHPSPDPNSLPSCGRCPAPCPSSQRRISVLQPACVSCPRKQLFERIRIVHRPGWLGRPPISPWRRRGVVSSGMRG
ncbi:hypothetical protein BU16DRAFT_123355 [Lophium mytilinum]|uniref:Uncharacterized protein n=1 Tax=Lophium mytilinum TaxID=390894 RepID=A0A6A6QHP2_9PEZI|nr:hypothetical protein BU16DRAFT_123355 [Lophium mytilinum]